MTQRGPDSSPFPTRGQRHASTRSRRRASARVRRRRVVGAVVAATLAVAGWAWGPQVWSAVVPDAAGPGVTGLAAAVLSPPASSSRLAGSDANGVAPVDQSPSADPPLEEPSADDATASPAGSDGSGEVAVLALPKGLTKADVSAGLRTKKIPRSGNGKLYTVKGKVAAPGKGRVYTVRVRVEGGLKVDKKKFAAFVMRVLNDDRSWGHGGKKTFARTDRKDADITVVLASPSLSASMCRPLVTYGKLSCRHGNKAVLTLYRWVKAVPDYGKRRTAYRRYLVNHEVGHVLGRGHQYCPGRGRLAPVMMQQTKGLGVCRPNSWPYP